MALNIVGQNAEVSPVWAKRVASEHQQKLRVPCKGRKTLGCVRLYLFAVVPRRNALKFLYTPLKRARKENSITAAPPAKHPQEHPNQKPSALAAAGDEQSGQARQLQEVHLLEDLRDQAVSHRDAGNAVRSFDNFG